MSYHRSHRLFFGGYWRTPMLKYEFISSPLLALGDPSPTPLAVRYDDNDNGNGQRSRRHGDGATVNDVMGDDNDNDYDG